MESNIWVSSFNELLYKAEKMQEFQIVHNELKKDFLIIYELANSNDEKSDSFKPMIRACVKELFMLIESDLYLINQWNPYLFFDPHDKFIQKFKETFKQHASSFAKDSLRMQFTSTNFRSFIYLKDLRDNITHPKGRYSIQVSIIDLNFCIQFYNLYTKFIQGLMNNVFLATQLPFTII